MRATFIADGADPRAKRLADELVQAGWDVALTSRPSAGEHVVAQGLADLLVFDPGIVGEDFLPRLRRRHALVPLIAWVPGPSSPGVAELLDGGADEALHGGMGLDEQVARLRAAARVDGSARSAVIQLGRLVVDATQGEVTWDDRPVPLTQREREVLAALAESAGRTVRREVIYRRVWGYTMARGDRSVDVNVKRLRAKLAFLESEGLSIATHAGVGYRLEVVEGVPQPAAAATVTRL